MTNSELIFEAFVNTSHRICGLKMRPLCILHLMWLEQIDSPLRYDTERITLRDIELAALICSSRSHDEILKKLERPPFLYSWINQLRKCSVEAPKWHAYLKDYFAVPEFGDNGSSRVNELPWLQVYLGALMKEFGMPLDEALTVPIGQAVWLNITAGYLNSGQTNVVSDGVKAAQEFIKSGGLTGGG